MNLVHRRVMPLRLENIFRNVHQHRTRTPARSQIERLVNDLRQIGDVLHQIVVLGAGARDAERVGFLKRVAADQLASKPVR